MATDYLMWFDSDPKKPLIAKITAAAARYQQKFGQPANLVLVNQAQYDPAQIVAGVEIEPKANVIKNHLLVGMK